MAVLNLLVTLIISASFEIGLSHQQSIVLHKHDNLSSPACSLFSKEKNIIFHSEINTNGSEDITNNVQYLIKRQEDKKYDQICFLNLINCPYHGATYCSCETAENPHIFNVTITITITATSSLNGALLQGKLSVKDKSFLSAERSLPKIYDSEKIAADVIIYNKEMNSDKCEAIIEDKNSSIDLHINRKQKENYSLEIIDPSDGRKVDISITIVTNCTFNTERTLSLKYKVCGYQFLFTANTHPGSKQSKGNNSEGETKIYLILFIISIIVLSLENCAIFGVLVKKKVFTMPSKISFALESWKKKFRTLFNKKNTSFENSPEQGKVHTENNSTSIEDVMNSKLIEEEIKDTTEVVCPVNVSEVLQTTTYTPERMTLLIPKVVNKTNYPLNENQLEIRVILK